VDRNTEGKLLSGVVPAARISEGVRRAAARQDMAVLRPNARDMMLMVLCPVQPSLQIWGLFSSLSL
jgi:hypothetical protein